MPEPLLIGKKPQYKIYDEEKAVKVKLQSYTQNAYEIIFDAALSSFGHKLKKRNKKITKKEMLHVVEEVLKGHMLPNILEGVVFTFYIEGISKIVHNQLVRHRYGFAFASVTSGNFSQRNTPHVCPPSIMKSRFFRRYKDNLEHCMELYCQLEDAGLPLEDIRNVLPMSITNQTIMSVNYRSLRAMIASRWCEPSQPLAWGPLCAQLKAEVTKVYPILGKYLRRGCDVVGVCKYPLDANWSIYNQFAPCGRWDNDMCNKHNTPFLYEEHVRHARKMSNTRYE